MFKLNSISSPDIFSTTPTVIVVLILSISNSFVFIGSIFFWSFKPKVSPKNFDFSLIVCVISGSFPFVETIQPVRKSALVRKGSRDVSIERLIPGPTSSKDSFPFCIDKILAVNVLYSVFPCGFFTFIPGFISISSPTWRVPFFKMPPKTPP